MHASHDEHDKVTNVVQEQLRRVANNRPVTLSMFEDSLSALPYWKMKELWKRELIEKENNQLSSEVVSELRNLLKPSIEQLIRTNRKNVLKQGFTFRRQIKGKTPHKGEDQYCFWKLDASDVLCMTDTDVDPRDAMTTADRFLNIELRLRLLDVPNPQSSVEVPPLPDDFSWIKPFAHDLAF
ncbi:hypothetical protein GCK32_017001 [Trichostrongylus colubriformis]|uniref:Uncharacterized protein n=1 Tax=Trichostrongylus colubriformis TaxID=6319 RepID=A0AAN8EQ66_TRICO